MVYISEDGRILETSPFSLKSIFGFFTGIVYMVIMFFKTLINPGSNGQRSSYSQDYRPGSGPPRPPRRLGRPNTGPSVNIPFGCKSCGG